MWPEGRPHKQPIRVNLRTHSLIPASGEPLSPRVPDSRGAGRQRYQLPKERSQGEEECGGGRLEKTLFLLTAKEGRWERHVTLSH